MAGAAPPGGRRFLPSQMRTQAEDNRLATLWLLTGPDCLPCTRRQWETFQAGLSNRRRTQRWLSWPGFAVILVFPVALSLLSVIPLSVHLGGEDPTVAESVTYVAALTCTSTLFSACLGMMFTGTFPDVSSESANAEQNVLTELKVRFDDLGHFLLKMSQDVDRLQQTQHIASNLNQQRLLASLKSQTTQAESRVEVALRFLCNVAEFLATGNTCHDSYLESWAVLHQSLSPPPPLAMDAISPSVSSSAFQLSDPPPPPAGGRGGGPTAS
eukprot:EG_transcript_16861